jgi:hypothetical protein
MNNIVNLQKALLKSDAYSNVNVRTHNKTQQAHEFAEFVTNKGAVEVKEGTKEFDIAKETFKGILEKTGGRFYQGYRAFASEVQKELAGRTVIEALAKKESQGATEATPPLTDDEILGPPPPFEEVDLPAPPPQDDDAVKTITKEMEAEAAAAAPPLTDDEILGPPPPFEDEDLPAPPPQDDDAVKAVTEEMEAEAAAAPLPKHKESDE